MKKTLFILLAILLLCISFAFTEGTKILTLPDKTTIVVPELAPEFFKWDTTVLAEETYPNGNGLIVTMSISPDELVTVISLTAKQGNKVFLLGLAAQYASRSNMDFEICEDLGFLQTGKPTGILVRVVRASPVEAFRYHLTKREI